MLFLLNFPTGLPASEQTPDTFSESDSSGLQQAYIGFRIGKYKFDSFHEVMVNEEEEPFLEVSKTLSELGLKGECDIESGECFTSHPFSKREYRHEIDSGNHLITKDGKQWLQYTEWGKWMPITPRWNRDNYQLNFNLHFILPAESLKLIQNRRKLGRREKLLRRRRERIKAIEPEDDFRPEVHYQLYRENRTGDYSWENGGKVNLNLDFMQGTFSSNTYASQFGGDDQETYQENETLWQYSRDESGSIPWISAGDIYRVESPLIPTITVHQGIYLKKKSELTGYETIHIRREVPPGTEADFFINGNWYNARTITDDGILELDNIRLNGSDILKINYFYPNGEIYEEVIQSISDRNTLLESRDWNWKTFTGQIRTREQTFSALSAHYGVFERLTLGGNYYLTSEYKDETATQEKSNSANLQAASLEWSLKPLPELFLWGESASHQTGIDHGFNLYLNWPEPYRLTYKKRLIQEESPLMNLHLGDTRTTDFERWEHNLSWNRWSLRYNQQKTAEMESQQFDIRRPVYTGLVAHASHTSEKRDTSENRYTTLGMDFNSYHHGVSVSANHYQTGDTYSARYAYQGRDVTDWDTYVTWYQGLDKENTFSLGITWTPGINFRVDQQNGKDFYRTRVSWDDILTTDNGPDNWNHFAMGTLKGRLMVPATEELASEPLAGVKIRAGRLTAVTDQNGYYKLTGLSYGQRLPISIDLETLPLWIRPLKREAIVKFRKGTTITYNPELTWSAGIDGQVRFTGELPKQLVIKILDFDKKQLIKAVSVGSDGIFYTEGLKPGFYVLMLSHGNKSSTLNIKINAGEVWKSGIELDFQR